EESRARVVALVDPGAVPTVDVRVVRDRAVVDRDPALVVEDAGAEAARVVRDRAVGERRHGPRGRAAVFVVDAGAHAALTEGGVAGHGAVDQREPTLVVVDATAAVARGVAGDGARQEHQARVRRVVDAAAVVGP